MQEATLHLYHYAMPADNYVFILRTATNQVIINDLYHGGYQDTYQLNNLLPNTGYKYKIRSTCSGVHQAYSDWIPFTTLGTGGPTCDIATGLNPSNITNTTATVSWDDMGADDYRLQVRIAGGAWIVNTLVTDISYDLSSLTPNTDYQFRIRSRCAGIWQDNTELVSFTTTGAAAPVCGPTGNLTASNVSSTSATLTWDDVNAEFYKIQVRPLGGDFILNTNIYTNMQTLTGLLPDTEYQFRVRPRCATFWPPFSGIVKFTTASTFTGNDNISRSKVAINHTNTQLNKLALSIAPNPSKGETFISYNMPTTDNMQLTLFDAQGKMIRLLKKEVVTQIGEHQLQFSTQDLPTGIYHLQLATKNDLLVRKLIILD